MLRRYSRYNQLLNGFITSSTSINIKHKLLFSTSKKVKKRKQRLDDDDDDESVKRTNPQQQYAEIWELTTDDKIERLTQELRKSSSGKKMAIFGSMSALLCAKMGWYQFQFLGMPQEMEVVMVHLPFTFLTIHWLSWYFNMNGIYKKLKFKLPPNWKANEGLIGGSNPEYHQLVIMNDNNNLILLDEWSKQMNKHRIICATMFCMNVSIIMLTGAINPFGDPALAALSPVTVMGYSFYPLVAYAFSAIIYGSPMKTIPYWKQEIVDELGVQQQVEDKDNDKDNDTQSTS